MDQVCYNPEFTMEMLEQWVAGTGPFASFPWGTPLQKTLGSLERYHYDSKQHLTCVSASCAVTVAAGLRGTASPSLTSWPGRCWRPCTVLYCIVLYVLYCTVGAGPPPPAGAGVSGASPAAAGVIIVIVPCRHYHVTTFVQVHGQVRGAAHHQVLPHQPLLQTLPPVECQGQVRLPSSLCLSSRVNKALFDNISDHRIR